jgi:hypothetical protein
MNVKYDRSDYKVGLIQTGASVDHTREDEKTLDGM